MLGFVGVLLMEVYREIVNYNVKLLVLGELSYFLGILYISGVFFKRIVERIVIKVFDISGELFEYYVYEYVVYKIGIYMFFIVMLLLFVM